MKTYHQALQEAEKFGDLLSAHEGGADLSRFRAYANDLPGFSREILGDTDPGPWSAQLEVMERLMYTDRLAWRGAQGIGKDWTVARAALWWAYARGGLVIISGPTARQVHEIIMRKEIARAFRRSGLPGELYTNSLRLLDEEAGILAFTSTEASGLTGFHDSEVLGILTEAQAVERAGWEGLMACTTGEDDTLFVVGNPLEPSGMFFEVSRPDSGWETVQTAATDHPNLTGRGHVPGGPSEEWLERMRDAWGEGTPMWVARVQGEFPRDSVQGLYAYADIEAAIGRHRAHEGSGAGADTEPVVAVDVARHGLDQSVACVLRGRTVEELTAWGGATTTETAKRVSEIAWEAGVRPDPEVPTGWRAQLKEQGEEVPCGTIVVDEIGIGAGVVDRLKDDRWPVYGFKGSKAAKDSRRHANARSEAYWRLRELLEGGEIALPDDRMLREEALAVKWSPDSKGRVQVEAKDDLKKRLGRSPDRLDAVTMALALSGRRGRGMTAEEMILKY